jgi:cellulose synthase/poly-beta-1,6-N-acetylglucosamine synthase-like glycosyltransferase
MAEPITIFYGILILFSISYLTIIGFYTVGWYRLKNVNFKAVSRTTRVSIIVPCRNEEDNIELLLSDLANQDYPTAHYEIIVVDDNSTDKTLEKINALKLQYPKPSITTIEIHEENQRVAFKKKAINLGIQESMGDLIISTDADCRMGNHWLSSIVGFYEISKTKMIVGPVSFHDEKTWFEKMQTLEFLSLVGITAGAISIGKPVMGNGANLVYEKSAYLEVGGFGNDDFSSGDDVFLMLKIKEYFGNKSVRFLKNDNAFVLTKAKKNLNEFIQQRTRWASKNKGYNLEILTISFTVFITNLILIAGLFWGIFSPEILRIILIFLLLKTLIELPVLIGVVNFAKRTSLLFYGLPLPLFYPIYIIVAGIMGMISPYKWKGRRIIK